MSKLFIVATPLGNLSDITLRALEVLKKVDYIVCEDTRVTSKLLSSYKISKPLLSFNEHSRENVVSKIISILKEGGEVAQVTDAGTPGVSDPGGVLVDAAFKEGIEVVGIPGPSSVALALSICGFPAGEFIFLGYFPKKKGRETLISRLRDEAKVVVFFESPYRINKTLEMLSSVLPEREIFIGRELTKKFGQIIRGKIAEVKDRVKPKGEFVLVLKGKK